MTKSIVGITVCYNTPRLLINSIESIKRFYPELEIIVINLSNDGYHYKKIDRVSMYHMNKNIGHGPGLHFALERVSQKYAICFDSDIIMNSPCLDKMISLIRERDAYAVGKMIRVDNIGHTYKGDKQSEAIKYIHPHFMLLDVKKYFLWPKFIHHGAPLLETMMMLKSVNKSNLLIPFPVESYITHLGRGTRRLGPKEFNTRYWDKVNSPNRINEKVLRAGIRKLVDQIVVQNGVDINSKKRSLKEDIFNLIKDKL